MGKHGGNVVRTEVTVNATLQPLFWKENISLNTHTHTYTYRHIHSPCTFALKVRRAQEQVKINKPRWRSMTGYLTPPVLHLRVSHITQVYWCSIFMCFLSVSTFSSVRAENVILPRGGPESRETSTGCACVPHILNQNHMAGLALMIFGWLAYRASNIQSRQVGTESIERRKKGPLSFASHWLSHYIIFAVSSHTNWLFRLK